MPLTVREGALLGAGVLLATGATVFYRQKATTPFRIAYFLAWPVLGSAIILTSTPSDERLITAMKRQGTVGDEQLAKAHQDVQLQMQRMREAGGQAPRTLPPPRQEPE